MSEKTKFSPVRGTEANILAMGKQDGRIYFATDTGHMFIDTATKAKFPVGGANSSGVYYVEKTLTDEEQVAQYMTFTMDDVQSDIMPSIDSLVLSTEYGIFYRVIEIVDGNSFICYRLTVAGSGGGDTSGLIQKPSILLGSYSKTVLYGQDNYIDVTPKSGVALGGVEVDTFVKVHWKIFDTDAPNTSYLEGDLTDESGSTALEAGATYPFNFGKYLFEDAMNQVSFTISGVNSGTIEKVNSFQVKCVNLSLIAHEDFKPLNMYEGSATLVCTVEGNIEKCLEFWVDEELIETKTLTAEAKDSGRMSCVVNNLTHGVHSVEIKLFQLSSGVKVASVDSLKYEIASKEAGNNTPIIWLGSYQNEYTNYDQILIPYMAFDPTAGDTCSVHFYKDATEEAVSPLSVTYTSDTTNFYTWEITNATVPTVKDAVINNSYYITCGNTTREISFDIRQTDDMTLAAPDNLKVNFSAAGRSNSESTLTRAVWGDSKFEDFNWYNNGWIKDSEGNTCLRISNGAKFRIPLSKITFNGTIQGQQSHTFEFEFKIRNVQNYSHLIKLVTRYTYPSDSGTIDDEAWYTEYKANWTKVYDSYDQFLQYYLPTQGLSYDNLEFKKVESGTPDINQAFCSYYDGTNGFGLGSQDSFFKTNSGTLNVNYVEDRKVNLALVYSKTDKLVSIYLNGVLSGTAYIADGASFTINQTYIEFSSEYCDIDLYRFRYYNTYLSIAEVLNNYAVDNHDLSTYIQSTSLSRYNETIQEYQLSYNDMVIFNQEHPDDYLMPYFVFSDVAADALPYSKADAKTATMTFVNTGLDRLYETGELEKKAFDAGVTACEYPIYWVKEADIIDALVSDSASTVTSNYRVLTYKVETDGEGKESYIENGYSKIDMSKFDVSKAKRSSKDGYFVIYRTLTATENYYLHHGASFEAKGCEIKVQGTSSQFYPRRNFKAKCKNVMMANKGPFVDDPFPMAWFFMDNDTIGTNKFTLKIDYMESSGSYNTGFANLVNNAYTKHPLDDYSKALTGEVITKDLRTSVQGFPAMAFHKKTADDSYLFIGRYNMNIDKGSDECYGFKAFENNDLYTAKKLSTNYVTNAKGKALKIADAAECWEFSDNNRGFCSFRDPNGRKITDIGDNPGDFFGITEGAEIKHNANGSCPVVADSFEYRYNTDGDLLDYLYNPTSVDPQTLFGEDGDYNGILESDYTNQTWRDNYLFDKMKNWEKACKWVWSTCTDEVDSEDTLYEAYAQKLTPAQHYIGEVAVYALGTDGKISTTTNLVFSETEEQAEIIKTIAEAKAELDALGVKESMLANATYGTKDEENSTTTTTVYKVTDEDYFQAYGLFTGQTYVSYVTIDGVNTATYKTGMIVPRTEVVTAMQNNPTVYQTDRSLALAAPYPSADNPLYYFDTKEYRLAKFKNEFSQHFDKEYALVYFVMTEVFMCYDSRGKNCMMASWGPTAEGGEYIWYPIFYDIDTQLGINNTGIPSFEYYVNATEDGCFSTNDSVLWGNIYQCFLDDIKRIYQSLRTSIVRNGSNGANIAPLAGIDYNGQNPVEHIENWYNCDPDVCNSLCMLGARPLLMKNFDEYYKYISIMNTGYQGMDGKTKIDSSHAFLYALQGDRSLSRQQFLSRRINFIDSWLCQGNYKEGTGSTIKFRTSANDPEYTSDKWVENSSNKNAAGVEVKNLIPNSPYYVEGTTTKTNYLDADFYVNLTPYQRSYVTLATDNAPLPSVEYKNSPVRMEFPTNVVTGIRKSPQYAEQLLYIYGADYLKDIGDVSLLYPREFELTGATHLSRIILGNDDEDFKNTKVKSPKFDAEVNAKGDGGKPLLKEVVFTNIRTDDETDQALIFTSSEKLQIFRALGMNISNVKFADGVALHTLHLPSSITELTLKEARNLTRLVPADIKPTTKNEDGSWSVAEGLYIEGLTDTNTVTNITRLNLAGGSLGYDSYVLLKRLFDLKEIASGKLAISITDFKWSPYTQMVRGTEYNVNELSNYYVDDGHYGFVPYNEYEVSGAYSFDNTLWIRRVANGLVYYKDPAITEDTINQIDDSGWTMLKNLATISRYTNTDETSNEVPRLTGDIYINNTTAIDEGYVRNTLLAQYYPDLNIHFANIEKAYSAQFISLSSDGAETVHDSYKVSKSDASGKFFNNPYETAKLNGDMKRQTEDFIGWSTKAITENGVAVNGDANAIITSEDWGSQSTFDTNPEVYDYKYYAVYVTHNWKITYRIDDDDGSEFETAYVAAGTKITLPVTVPAKDSSALDLDKVWIFKGYALTKAISSDSELLTINADGTLNKTASADTIIYLLFTEGSVYDNVLDDKYLQFSYRSATSTSNDDYGPTEQGLKVSLVKGYSISGKITLPASHVITAEDTAVLSGGKKDNVKVGDKLKIVAINESGFKGQTALTHVFLEKGSSLQSIGQHAFSGCSQLTYFEMIPSVKWIGPNGFSASLFGNNSNDSANLLGRVEHIGAYAFSTDNANKPITIAQIVVPGTVQYIGSGAFGYWDTSIIQLGTKENPIYIPSFVGGEETHNNVKYYWASDCFVDLVGPDDSDSTICVNVYSSLSSATEVQNRIGSCFRLYGRTIPGEGFSYSALDI